jgi:multidrug efflux pump subunit AcrA (membrane-fusion protein)
MRRPELVLGPPDASGQYVVKDPVRRTYYRFGRQEYFLLSQLDGKRSAGTLCERFEAEFQESLAPEDVADFLAMLGEWGLLVVAVADTPATVPVPRSTADRPAPGRCAGSVLAFRLRMMDPDRLFTFLAPRLTWAWTPAFVAATIALILLAGGVAFAARREFAASIPLLFTWEKLILAWLVLITATFLHECGHGMTCKHYGGDVYEIGFLVLYFTPCFYCDVSDAWILPETRKRLWIMLAGSYCDLILWSLSVLLWRVTLRDTAPHDLAWIVASVCGVRIFLNMNPLIRLDGYYLVSDYLQLPNLRQRAWDTTAAQLRRLLWGAPRPALTPADRPWLLLGFGLLSWCYSAFLIFLMLFALFRFTNNRWGLVATTPVLLLAASLVPALFAGIFAGEVRRMLLKRPFRTAFVCLIVAGLAAGATWGTMEDSAAGPFRLRAAHRAEVRAPVTGYLRTIAATEGARLEQGAALTTLEVPDLLARLAQKRAEIDEYEVKIRVLLAKHAGDKETDALQAHIVSLRAEVAYLEDVARRQAVAAPLGGIVITPRVAEKVGQYLRDGDLICELEDPAGFEIEIALPEQEALRVHPGQRVSLKARAFPTGALPATVIRIAAAASPPVFNTPAGTPPPLTLEIPSTLTVYCTLDAPAGASPEMLAALRSNMTGYARIDCGRDRVAVVLARRLRHFLRTEFWW